MATVRLENGQILQLPDGISATEVQKYVDQANALGKPESAPKRFARGVGDSLIGQAKGAVVPEGLGGDLLPSALDDRGNPQVVDPHDSMGQRALQMTGLGPLASLFQSDPARAIGQLAAQIPAAVQGLFTAAGKTQGVGVPLKTPATITGATAPKPLADFAASSTGERLRNLPVRKILNNVPGLRWVSRGVQAWEDFQDAMHPERAVMNKARKTPASLEDPYNKPEANPDPYSPKVDPLERFKSTGVPTEDLLRHVDRGLDAGRTSADPEVMEEYWDRQRNVESPGPSVYRAGDSQLRPPGAAQELTSRNIHEADPYSTGWQNPKPLRLEDVVINPGNNLLRSVERGVGAGPEVDVGIKYPPPKEPAFPSGPYADPYNSPVQRQPINPQDVQVTPQDILNLQGVGAGPELSPGLKYPKEKPPKYLTMKPKSAPDFTGRTDVWDQGYRPPPPEEAVPQYGQPRVPSGAAAPAMDFEAPVPKQLHQQPGTEGTPPPAQPQPEHYAPATAKPQVVPQTVSTPSVQQQLGLERPPGMSDSDWQGMLNRVANRQARAKEAVDYFKGKGFSPEDIKQWAEESPASGPNRQHGGRLAEHARTFGNKRPFTESIVQEILRLMQPK